VKTKTLLSVLALLLLFLTGCGEDRIRAQCLKKTSIDAFALRIRANYVPFFSYYSIEISRSGEWGYVELFREPLGPPDSRTPGCVEIGTPAKHPDRILGLFEKEAISVDEFKTWKVRPRTRW
jgi:hypothetical protein